ncbi:gamma-aminobutyric acid type B receptor subunit 1-like isoform X2 [Halichondria panicea]|uniref:gamma-aminobutyric acid type B receptor subunit 1-like isoform X2 n=1 Tax=Halichondria panicea TaxID=6063 RepID=UPI00312BB0A8
MQSGGVPIVSLLLLVTVLTGVAGISSENVNCTAYAPACDASMCPSLCPSKTKTLYIQGFVPAKNNEFRSETIVPAAFAAIDEINANCSILPEYKLVLEFVNTKCDPSEATWQLINSIVLQDQAKNVTKIMFFGGGCSLATEPLAALAGRFYEIPMLSYGASSPALSDNQMFPKFFRTLPSETQANSARIAVMNKYGWTKVATLHETEAIFTSSADNFHKQYDDYITNVLKNSDRNELILRSFTDNPDIPLGQIKAEDIRIIIGYYYENQAVQTLCKAFKMGLHETNNLWMYIAWYDSDWWMDLNGTTNCTMAELKQAVRNSLLFDSYNLPTDKETPTDTGNSITFNQFKAKYDCYLEEFLTNDQTRDLSMGNSVPHRYFTYTWDAVYTLAFALEQADKELKENHSDISLDDFKYFDNRTAIIPQLITKYMADTDFIGVSGRVIFDTMGTRISTNAVFQLRENNTTDELDLVLLGIHSPYGEFENVSNLTTNFQSFNFTIDPLFNTGGKAPADRVTPVDKYIDPALIYVCDVIIGISLIIAIALLIFNLATFRMPLIRDSAPLVNMVIILGCILMLITAIMLGIDTQTPDIRTSAMEYINHRYTVFCNLRLWFFTLGFTLSFGALLAKTSQVYRVYTNQSLKKEDLQMWRFFLIIGIFLLIDVAYLSFWTGVEEFRLKRGLNTTNEAGEQFVHEQCDSSQFGYLIGALYVYKGLLVVFGLFLAYESRNVKYFKINDSRFVSIAMYIVVILIGIGAPLSLVLSVYHFADPAYALSVFMIVASTLSCLLIIHVPKFVYMAKGKDTMIQENMKEEIAESSGLQLGTAVDITGIKTTEMEVADLRSKNEEREMELRDLQTLSVATKPRNGSDNDSGVLVTGDETETFTSEIDENRPNTATPSEAPPTPGTSL